MERIYIDGSEDNPTVTTRDDSHRETITVMNESWITETTLTERLAGGRTRITYPDGTVIEHEDV